MYSIAANSIVSGQCTWSGGLIGLWVAAGNSGTERVTITANGIGANSITYVNQISAYTCKAFYENVTLPAQTYNVTLQTGSGGGSCGSASVTLNTTTTPPPTIRNFVYNGDFGTGTYGGWDVTGAGFGKGPLNVTLANSESCYMGQPWSGYNGTFFATTYTCGSGSYQGNITSSRFLVNPRKSFLNFKVVSQEDSYLYVELLENNTPEIVAHYNTYNLSIDYASSSTFRNVSMDLSHVAGKVVRIRVVSGVTSEMHFIAIGDFVLASRPVQQSGIIANISYNFT